MLENFKEICEAAGLDKQVTHNYGYFYEAVIKMLRCHNENQPIKVVEVGVVGASVEKTSEYAFAKCADVEMYVGIDTLPLAHAFFGTASHFVQGDAYDESILEKLKPFGDFHLLIDDGSHQFRDQIEFFNIFQNIRAEKSVMVCEEISVIWAGYILEDMIRFGLKDSHLISTCLGSGLPTHDLLSHLIVNYQL